MALINFTQQLVTERLDILLEGTACCKCEICHTDMLACALNNVKPCYVNSHKGELFGRVDAGLLQHSIDLDIAVLKAIELVSTSPRHTPVD